MARAIDVAEKLDLTALALGCLTRKELCIAFYRINPKTVMTLQNCHNWISGRSTPRNFSVYEDWAQVLGLDEGPHFVMSSTLAAFTRRLSTKMDLPEALLPPYPRLQDVAPGSAEAKPRVTAPDAADLGWRTNALLQGSYLMLSLAFAPRARGRILGGALLLEARGEGELQATYVETILEQRVPFEGVGKFNGHVAQLTLTCTANSNMFFLALHMPILPGNLGAGVFAGNTIYDVDSTPSACPALLIRNHALTQAELEGRTNYLYVDAEALAGELAVLGYDRDPRYAAENSLLHLLTRSSDIPLVTVGREALTHAATLLDDRRLRAALAERRVL